MGCGKSVVGVIVAQRAGAPFYDLDFIIENESGMSISDIFATRGEAGFRALEAQLLPTVLKPGAVVAVGGGAPTDEANWKLMTEQSVTIFLDCPFTTIWERVKGESQRPLVATRSREQLEQLLAERRPRYEKATHHVNGDRPSDVVAAEVLKLWSG
jgi:shikimate kinase